MPKFIHDRAKHIMAKNPGMPESTAFGVATQQSHALGKTPKGYGTSEAKAKAKKKFDTPGDDVKTADPDGIGKEALFGGSNKEFSENSQKLFKKPIDKLSDEEWDQVLHHTLHLPVSAASQKHWNKSKTAAEAFSPMITSPFDVALVEGFSDEFQKIADEQVKIPVREHIRRFVQEHPVTAAGLLGGGVGTLLGGPGVGLASGALSAGTTALLHHAGKKKEPSAGQVKIAAGAENVSPMAQVKSTIPDKPLSGKIPKYSKVHPPGNASPSVGVQPVSEPPQVRR